MTKIEYKKFQREYRKCRKLLQYAYRIQDRDERVRQVGKLQGKLVEMKNAN